MTLASSGRAELRSVRVSNEQSRVEVVVRATVDSFVAELRAFDAVVVCEPQTGQIETATFRFDFRQLFTGKAERDRQMHEWQDTAHFPDGLFRLTHMERTSGGQFVASGELQFHGETQAVTFPVSVTRNDKALSIDGEAVVDVRTFGLKPIRKLAVLRVNPEVVVRFHLQGRIEPLVPAASNVAVRHE
jgi:polyisoprenoid-binding protein YceI